MWDYKDWEGWYQFLIGYISNIFLAALMLVGGLYQFLIGYISNISGNITNGLSSSYQFLIGYISNSLASAF